jgi:tetratricopeptide (TPR) repeat protein
VACVPVPPYRLLLQGDEARRAQALAKQADELWAAGKFDEALGPAEEAAALRRKAQGDGHWQAADAARLVETLRRAAALPAEKRAALAEAPGLIRKAAAAHGRGKYAEAEPLLRKALAAYEAALGPDHPLAALGYGWLARNYSARGRPKEAEPLERKAVAALEKALGPGHPDTAAGYHNLARTLGDLNSSPLMS